MTVYIPISYENYDTRPSWTGNYTYETCTIRGIFSSMEKAEAAIGAWHCADDYEIETREFYDYDFEASKGHFDIYYEDRYAYIDCDKNGDYTLDEVVDEPYSCVYDPECHLGVDDY